LIKLEAGRWNSDPTFESPVGNLRPMNHAAARITFARRKPVTMIPSVPTVTFTAPPLTPGSATPIRSSKSV